MLNWSEVRGVSGMGLEIDGILLKAGEHELCSVYASVVLLEYRITEECSLVREDRKKPTAQHISLATASDRFIHRHQGDKAPPELTLYHQLNLTMAFG